MTIIRRYPNRKLYSPITNTYVSLQYVDTLRRSGQPFKVWDLGSSRDVTWESLCQIALLKFKTLSKDKQEQIVKAMFSTIGE